MCARRLDSPPPDVLYRLYVEEQKSTPQVAEALGISTHGARGLLKRANIPMRSQRDSMNICIAQGRRRTVSKKGADNPWWRGGRRVASSGYIEVLRPDHPRARRNGYVFEHLVVWEEHNGPLPPGWHIHHINGDKQNNAIENLRGMLAKEHALLIAMHQAEMRELQEENRRLRERIADLEQEQRP